MQTTKLNWSQVLPPPPSYLQRICHDLPFSLCCINLRPGTLVKSLSQLLWLEPSKRLEPEVLAVGRGSVGRGHPSQKHESDWVHLGCRNKHMWNLERMLLELPSLLTDLQFLSVFWASTMLNMQLAPRQTGVGGGRCNHAHLNLHTQMTLPCKIPFARWKRTRWGCHRV